MDLGLWWQLPKEVIVLLPVRTWDLSSCVTGTFTELLVQSAGLGFGGFPLILFAAGALPASYLALWGPQSSMRLRKGTWGARAPWGKGSVLLGPCPTQDRDLWEELGVALSVPAGCSKEPTDLLLCRPPQKASTHGGWGLRELDHLSSFPQPPSILNVERPVGTFLLLWDGVWRVSPHPWHGHLQCRSRGLLGAPVRNTPGGNPIASFLLLSRLGGGAMLA